MSPFTFDNSYARELPGFYVAWKPAAVPAPRLLFLNRELAAELGADAAAVETLAGEAGAAWLAGNVVPEGAEPLAQAYAGHQFGGFSPQLGDGRALLLGEVIDRRGQRRDIAFKGSGRTPFSRGGDGKAAVGPMLREVIIGEAMHALGIPTTRALAVVATGDRVYRENAVLPGAVLTRVAASHLRVGTFEFFTARGDLARLQQLAGYTIARHDPALAGAPQPWLALLRVVAARQAELVAQWMNVGFIHGVMNTDNMTISGETIDYGPCAFMEAFDPATVFSSIDHGGRYAFGNQPLVARWNLAKLAEALLPLAPGVAPADGRPGEGGARSPGEEGRDGGRGDDAARRGAHENQAAIRRAVAEATEVIDAFPALYERALREGQRRKLGLAASNARDDATAAADAAMADDWLSLLQRERIDFTLAWRRLADAAAGDEAPLRALFVDDARSPDAWLDRWHTRCAVDDAAAGVEAGSGAAPEARRARAARMRRVNPFSIPRNHRVEEALAAASNDGDLVPFERLLAAVRRPFDETPELAPYGEPAPAALTAGYRTFCGT
ncbi:MAG: YdiU family protein [Rubrivivax sp.]|nr:YdiU family protein [Rubrivivax sp.]